MPTPPAPSSVSPRPLLGNAWRMMLLWIVFGAAVGLLTAPAPRDPITLVAHAIAGVIVLSPLGAVLGLLGARRRDALLTASFGGAAGLLVGLGLHRPDLGYPAAFGLIVGTLIGTTFAAFFYRLPRRILAGLHARG